MIKIDKISDLLNAFITENHGNRVKELDNMIIYDKAIVGVAEANDPLFFKLKKDSVVGPHHMSPGEWLPDSKSVISYFIPFSHIVRRTNRIKDGIPSTEWLYGRIEGEEFNNHVRQFIVDKLIEMGGKAIAPHEDSRYTTVERRSNWSERHVAYIAGLGTFGLAKNLITEKGCAGRIGSVITNLEIEPTKRNYSEIYEYCNDCGACIIRCPAKAITKAGKEHDPCDDFIGDTKTKFAPRYGCGKCQTAVPCESRIPKKIK